MSEILEKNISNKPNLISFPNKENLKDFCIKELKTTHTGWICINYNNEYLRERLSKLKEESNILRKKIDSIENKNLKERNYLEKIILSLREENNFLKKNYEMQKININTLNKEKQKLLNDLQELTGSNNNLAKDKELLIQQIKDLNNIINKDISPKLKINENDLIFLQDKINELQKIIISLKNEKIRLIDDNNNKNEFIKVLTNQNKKLLKEIKMKYNKDLSLIKSIEKIGIGNQSFNKEIYLELMDKYENRNKNINNKIKNHSYNNICCSKENNGIYNEKNNNNNSCDNSIKEKIDKIECEE